MKHILLTGLLLLAMTLFGCAQPAADLLALPPAPTEQPTLATEATQPPETVPEETLPEPTQPAETVPEETLPEPTQPAETVPEETLPEPTQSPADPKLPEYTPDAYALALLEKVNEARIAHGLAPLELDLTVSRLAYVRAQEAAMQWSHTRPNGEPCYSVYADYRIPRIFWTGENLANYALQDAQLIVDSWMASEAHRNNILYPDYTAAGMAVYWSAEKYYIANLFRSDC